ncbi:hypothetical protein BU24DRAFT_467562 [Aaosphaeria arxii CBS 175.79]|uniref:Uncharacterized protein n=1 Tax=Aaosphaeria arxii CBS 175.79 TaxID=1450172 RepID=A0A6A5XAI6_9PLEO|nr:uncharacterized protein BU24DRAFT_467562 [Aaosphaeria arxii CBS 175.79]KAF2010075.1 hypothetical protein BU24DRAFT_467562 [Aaosphaeria arxii CBS 175.79]
MGGQTGNYYSVEEYNSWKRKLGANYRSPPKANFLAAATYIRNLLDGKKMNWAAIGGLAMLCLGSRREMPDIHIVYEDRDYNKIKMKLEADPRVRLPRDMNPLFPSKILISTGPKFRDAGCTHDMEVELDLVPPGSQGTPPNDVLRKNQNLLRLSMDGKMQNFKGLNILYLVKTTLEFCKRQDLMWDPKHDLYFLCCHFGKELEAIRHRLDVKAFEKYFFSTLFYSRLAPADQRRCSVPILGKELLRSPPPMMAITPPPETTNQAPTLPNVIPPQPTRPILHPSKSTPQLSAGKPSVNSLLTPPMPGRAKLVKPPPKEPNLLPKATTSNPNTTAAGTEPREIRSRYRQTAPPITPGHSRSASSNMQAVPTGSNTQTRPRSMESLAPSRLPNGPVSNTVARGVEGVMNGQQALKGAPLHKTSSANNGVPAGKNPVPIFAHSVPIPDPRIHPVPPIPAQFSSPNHPTAASTHTHRNSPGAHRPTASSTEKPKEAKASGLRVVGPDGLYAAQPKPPRPTPPPAQAQIQAPPPKHAETSISPPIIHSQSGFAFELPGSTPSSSRSYDISPLQSPDATPVKLPEGLMVHQGAPAPPRKASIPHVQPQATLPRPAEDAVHQHDIVAELPADHPGASECLPTRPHHPRTQSEPIVDFPSSLMAGRSQNVSQNYISHAMPSQQPESEQIQTNANRYAGYTVNNYYHPAVTSQYKAYTGVITPPMPPTAAPISQDNPYHDQIDYSMLPRPLQSSHKQVQEFGPSHSEHKRYDSAFTPPPSSGGKETYQRGDEPRFVNLQPLTGYEDFAHGPYTPVDLQQNPFENQGQWQNHKQQYTLAMSAPGGQQQHNASPQNHNYQAFAAPPPEQQHYPRNDRY